VREWVEFVAEWMEKNEKRAVCVERTSQAWTSFTPALATSMDSSPVPAPMSNAIASEPSPAAACSIAAAYLSFCTELEREREKERERERGRGEARFEGDKCREQREGKGRGVLFACGEGSDRYRRKERDKEEICVAWYGVRLIYVLSP
jgi:hypothetical protein